MSTGCFTEKNREPSDEEVRHSIGPTLPLWDELIRHIRENYAPVEDFKFLYGKTYGWGRRFRLKGSLLATLYPALGCYKVQIILKPQAVDEALSMSLGLNTRRAIESANPYPEGRWLFIPVESAGDMEDVRRLLVLRAKGKKNAVKTKS